MARTTAVTIGVGDEEEPEGDWPNLTNTGLPDGWAPTVTYTSNRNASTTGTNVGGTRIIEDIRFDGASLMCNISNVTIRRCHFIGSQINTWPGAVVQTGILIEDCLIEKGGYTSHDTWDPSIHPGNYTARRVQIVDMPEGFRSGANGDGATYCTIEDSWVRVKTPDVKTDWHGDGLQGYGAPPTTVTNCYFELWVSEPGGEGTAPFFYPDQGNDPVTVNGLIVNGSGGFRLGVAGSSVTGLRVVSGGHSIDDGLTCAGITWTNNWNATIDASYQPTDTTPRNC